MATVNPAVDETPGAAGPVDPESAEWLGALAGSGPQREAALARLHEMLLRIAQRECRRRGPRLRITGPELEDLAYQATADALVAITRKLGQFRGESRFTTWRTSSSSSRCRTRSGGTSGRTRACHWTPRTGTGCRTGSVSRPRERPSGGICSPCCAALWTPSCPPRQRQVFVAIVVNAVPLDALAIELGSNRNAIYKTMFDARRKLRAALAANGYMGHDTGGRS